MYGPAIEPIAAAAPQDELSSGLQTFTKVLNLVETNFADQVPLDKALYDGAMPGMLRTLDPHSSFLDPKTYQLMQQNQRGQYYGVGMEINMDGNYVVVTQPFAGSPAYQSRHPPRRSHRFGGRPERDQDEHGRGGRPAQRTARHQGDGRHQARRRDKSCPS